MSESSDEGALNLTRTIPIPESVSPEAQALMAMGGQMLADRLASPPEFPALDDHEAWKATITAMDEQILMGVELRIADIDATVEQISIDGIDVFVIAPAGADTGESAPILFDIHGGALIAGGGQACRAMGTVMAAAAGLVTWAVDYRMPPDHPYPTSLDDCLAVYRALLDVRSPAQIAVSGSSAGGNLAAALMLRAWAEGLPMPACLVLNSPEADLTESGDSFETNQGVDYVLVNRLTESIALYAHGHDLEGPFLSPLFGDVSHFPPTYLQTGTRDLFLSNTVRFHRKLRAAGVEAELHIGEAMPHGGFFGFAPEDAELEAEMHRFIAKHL